MTIYLFFSLRLIDFWFLDSRVCHTVDTFDATVGTVIEGLCWRFGVCFMKVWLFGSYIIFIKFIFIIILYYIYIKKSWTLLHFITKVWLLLMYYCIFAFVWVFFKIYCGIYILINFFFIYPFYYILFNIYFFFLFKKIIVNKYSVLEPWCWHSRKFLPSFYSDDRRAGNAIQLWFT